MASVNGNNYETVAAAVNAAAVNDTVVILRNVEESAVSVGKKITLNLAGYTLTGNLTLSSAAVVAIAGPGTVKGDVTHSEGTAAITAAP